MTRIERVGVVGLGNIGMPLATSLTTAGFEVMGYDVDASRSELLASIGGVPASDLRELGGDCEYVITSLPTSESLKEVVWGSEGLLESARPDLHVLEMSTLDVDAKVAARDALASRGTVVLDCPVSGTARQAQAGNLVVFASGPEEACRQAGPILDAVARQWHFVGPFGDGSRVKLVASMLVAVHNVAAAEALVLSRKLGLDPERVHHIVSDSAATSRMFEVSGPLMLHHDFERGTSRVDVLYKSLSILQEFAAKSFTPMPLLSVASTLYASAMSQGMASREDACVYELVEIGAGLQRAVGELESAVLDA